MKRPVILLLLVAALVAAVPASAAVLSSAGDIYEVHAGTYGALFPAGTALAAELPVLALEVRSPDGERHRMLVPGTDDFSVERSAYLAFEEASGTVFVVWESRTNLIHSNLKLVGYGESEWTEVIDVSEQQFSWQSEPRLATTRDSYLAPGGDREVQRTVVHVLWLEERASGHFVTYAPLVLLDGTYLGGHTIFTMDDLLAVEPGEALTGTPPVAPTLFPTGDGHSVVAGFALPRTGRFTTVRLSVLAGDLAAIADGVGDWIADQGPLMETQGLEALASGMGGHMIDIGVRMDAKLLEHVAGGMGGHMIDIGVTYRPRDIEKLALAMRDHMIDIGFSLEDRGLRGGTGAGTSRVFELVSIDSVARPAALATLPPVSHVGELTLVSERPLPPLPAGVEDHTFLSTRGDAAIVAWDIEGQVRYVVSTPEGWSAQRWIQLDDSMSRSQAYDVLAARVRNRTN
ncbi:MAG TPA: hypothetical protein VHQ65_13445 [Thermoanaerobaculia bacterium]|nr:hypothetical protein [Thermoanaerobaculia bacterium]